MAGEALCSEGHPLTTRRGTCSFCSNRKVLCGFNDIACLRPDLLTDWADERDPHAFVFGSNTYVDWRCPKGHEWKAPVRSRWMGAGCKKCSWTDNGIVAKREKRVLLVDHSPELAATVVDKELLSSLTFSSHRQIEWTCDLSHVFTLSPNQRKSRGCPFCAGRQVLVGFNDISTYPDVAAELVDPALVHTAVWSREPILWRHVTEEGVIHEWSQAPSARIGDKAGCLICSSYLVMPGVNDVATTHPHLAEQWGPTNIVKPTEVSFGSNERIAFLCSRGHEWFSSVKSAANGRRLCRECEPVKEYYRSQGEREVHAFMQDAVFPLLAEPSVKRFKRHGIYEFDIFIPELSVAIDYNGIYWHQDKFKGEGYHEDKLAAARELGIRLYFVWEDDWRDNREDVEAALRELVKLRDDSDSPWLTRSVNRAVDPPRWRRARS